MRNGFVNVKRAPLPALIALVLGAPQVMAQDGPPPGLYTTVDQAEIYIIQPNGEQTDVKTGESVRVTEDGLEFIAQRPQFLNWPCGTGFAPNRGTLPTFSLDSLPPGDQIGQVADLYFSNQQVLDSSPRWLNGESHGAFPASEIDQFVSNAYWYKTGPADAELAEQRPKTLLISLFYGTGQVVVDTNHLDALKEEYGDDPIPTVFQYQEENVVPISYFGDNPTPEQIMNGYNQSGIKPADVPMWYAGDQHVSMDPGALADALGVPPAGDMSPARLQDLQDDIGENGFNAKPVTLAFVPGDDSMVVDEGERLRAAQQAGVSNVPVMFSVYENDMIASQCGLAPPVAAAGLLGTSEGEAPGAETPEEPGEGPGDGPGDGPEQPEQPPRPVPPEIEPPQPPQPEQPVSDN